MNRFIKRWIQLTKSNAPHEPIPEDIEKVAAETVDAAYKVHTTLGPGLLENVYEICLVHELARRRIRTQRQIDVPVVYDSVRLESGLRLDLVVDGRVIVEIKAVEEVLPVHLAQLVTYLKITGYRVGLLINFNEVLIKDGMYRRVN
ncbi:MAG TPA: GxxExxY protein [Planctomycetota bacterium]|nr:GxxExxY protein [Planctomycetota bacterium]